MQTDIVPCEICRTIHYYLDAILEPDFTKTSPMYGTLHVVTLCSEECRKKYLEQRDKFNEFLSMQPWG